MPVWLALYGDLMSIEGGGDPLSTIDVADRDFDLFIGQNGSFTVLFPFAKENIDGFDDDIRNFIQDIVKRHHQPLKLR